MMLPKRCRLPSRHAITPNKVTRIVAGCLELALGRPDSRRKAVWGVSFSWALQLSSEGTLDERVEEAVSVLRGNRKVNVGEIDSIQVALKLR